jgi:hypothetical protein
MAQVRRLISEDMPVEQITFYTRMSPHIVEEEMRKMEQTASTPDQVAGEEASKIKR